MSSWLYKQDTPRLAAVGIPYFSFSIPWTRVVSLGTAGPPLNQRALDHYEDVVEFCHQDGITPLVTLNHFNISDGIQFTPPEYPETFLYYAKQILTRFDDRVPCWITVVRPFPILETLME